MANILQPKENACKGNNLSTLTVFSHGMKLALGGRLDMGQWKMLVFLSLRTQFIALVRDFQNYLQLRHYVKTHITIIFRELLSPFKKKDSQKMWMICIQIYSELKTLKPD